VSSRQEEKEQRRRERLERERAEQQAAKRKRLVQILGGVVLGAAIVVGVVLAIAGGGKDETRDAASLTTAAKAAGCVVRSFPNYGQQHVTRKLTAADYKTNPATSGPHVPPGQEAPDGVYVAGNEPEVGNWVHTLEHGRILFQYKPGTSPARIAQLKKLFDENVLGKPGYHSVLMQNNTKMPFEVAAVAWRHYVGCPKFTDKSIPAMRAFRDVYVDTAPEQIP
jgi:hypothetical protein